MYYEDQLNQVNTKTPYATNLKITSGDGETKWLSLNPESAKAIVEWLTKNYLNEQVSSPNNIPS